MVYIVVMSMYNSDALWILTTPLASGSPIVGPVMKMTVTEMEIVGVLIIIINNNKKRIRSMIMMC